MLKRFLLQVKYYYYFTEKTSVISNLLCKYNFWENRTSLYYQELLCIPNKIKYFFHDILHKKIPFETPDELVYQRVFDYTFYQYTTYFLFDSPKDGLEKELINDLSL